MLSRTFDVLSDRGVVFLHIDSLLRQQFARHKKSLSAYQPGCPRSDIRDLTCEARIKGGTPLASHDRRGIIVAFSKPNDSNVHRAQRHRQFEARVASSASQSSDDVGSSYEELQAQLDEAVRSENYGAAAVLRDQMSGMQEGRLSDILAANTLFYRAFEKADMRLMDRIWAHGDHVQCLHPGSLCISGRDQILQSWRYVLGSAGEYKVELEDVRVHCNGTLAFVTCVENHQRSAAAGRIVATNVFELQRGEWLICLHQGGPVIPTSSNAGL